MPKGAGVFSYFLLGVFALAPLVMMFATGAKHPEQITLPYDNTIVIEISNQVYITVEKSFIQPYVEPKAVEEKK